MNLSTARECHMNQILLLMVYCKLANIGYLLFPCSFKILWFVTHMSQSIITAHSCKPSWTLHSLSPGEQRNSLLFHNATENHIYYTYLLRLLAESGVMFPQWTSSEVPKTHHSVSSHSFQDTLLKPCLSVSHPSTSKLLKGQEVFSCFFKFPPFTLIFLSSLLSLAEPVSSLKTCLASVPDLDLIFPSPVCLFNLVM